VTIYINNLEGNMKIYSKRLRIKDRETSRNKGRKQEMKKVGITEYN
jgi:hypothetical protein